MIKTYQKYKQKLIDQGQKDTPICTVGAASLEALSYMLDDLAEASNSLEKRITELEKDRADDNKEFYERLGKIETMLNL